MTGWSSIWQRSARSCSSMGPGVLDRFTSRRTLTQSMLPPPSPISFAASRPCWRTPIPPAILVALLVNRFFVGDEDEEVDPAWLTAMLLLALAATVLEPSINLLMNPVFFTLGVVRPPSTPALWPKLLRCSHPTADCAPALASRLEEAEPPVGRICGLSSCPRVPVLVIGLLLRLPS